MLKELVLATSIGLFSPSDDSASLVPVDDIAVVKVQDPAKRIKAILGDYDDKPSIISFMEYFFGDETQPLVYNVNIWQTQNNNNANRSNRIPVQTEYFLEKAEEKGSSRERFNISFNDRKKYFIKNENPKFNLQGRKRAQQDIYNSALHHVSKTNYVKKGSYPRMKKVSVVPPQKIHGHKFKKAKTYSPIFKSTLYQN